MVVGLSINLTQKSRVYLMPMSDQYLTESQATTSAPSLAIHNSNKRVIPRSSCYINSQLEKFLIAVNHDLKLINTWAESLNQ